ncbi:hypothetical protein [Lacimicrobium alkaliphilum]|uniref:Uncharacterized protein n=1 Tax=Lacimicrobium alkaliphilum TaxID=1526571 RepID=A0ABQ1RBU0_9ALTE|nr:hypothetical protein [Lacimicrobium alkaliphilum]GGD62829.1 hypothetical protein GCM10011357_17650 [Lacimicrobium alkaliphilum]
MSKQKAFWLIWISFTLFIIVFFSAVGELKQIDFGKSILLTIIPLACAYPIYRWVKSNDDFK